MSCSEIEAVVTEVANGVATVRPTQMPSSCGRCGEAGGCGKSSWATATPRQFAIRNGIGARAGDAVILSVPATTVLRAAVFAYLLPAVLAILGAAGASAAVGEGGPAVAGAAAGLVVGLLAMRRAGGGESSVSMRFNTVSSQHKEE